MQWSRKFITAAALFATFAAVAADTARIRVVNKGRCAIELDDGTVVAPGTSAITEVPASRPGTICGEQYPAIMPNDLYTLRVGATSAESDIPAEPPTGQPTVKAPAPRPAPSPMPEPRPAPSPAPAPRPAPANDGAPVTTPPPGMVLVPAGTNEGIDPEYGPYSLISPGFYMDRSEITLNQWRRVYDWAIMHGYRFDNEGKGKGANHPVHTVNWYDCAKWCNARSEMEGLKPVYYFRGHVLREDSVKGLASPDVVAFGSNDGYRLPSRDQWDYAARGGVSSTLFPWGNEITRANANVLGHKGTPKWFDKVSRGDPASDPLFEYDPHFRDGGMPFTCPAETFPPNGYGLTEMQGNVNEWLNDTSFWAIHQEGAAYGGSWANGAEDCLLGILFPKERRWANDTIGFRTVLPAGDALPFTLIGGEPPEAVHPDADERTDPVIFDPYGWRRRVPSNDLFALVREGRQKERLASGADETPRDAGPKVIQEDVVPPASNGAGDSGDAPATLPAADGKRPKVQSPAAPPERTGFHVKRASAANADLMVYLDKGDATITPNSNFSFGFMHLGLENRTKYHVAVCVIRVFCSIGTSCDVVFTDIPPGGRKKSDEPMALLGDNVEQDFLAAPFLFPALILAVGSDGKLVDLYETPDCPSVGYLKDY